MRRLTTKTLQSTVYFNCGGRECLKIWVRCRLEIQGWYIYISPVVIPQFAYLLHCCLAVAKVRIPPCYTTSIPYQVDPYGNGVQQFNGNHLWSLGCK